MKLVCYNFITFKLILLLFIHSYGESYSAIIESTYFKNFEHKYRNKLDIPWKDILQVDDQRTLLLLNLGLYQEAIWSFNNEDMFDEAKSVANFLEEMLTHGTIYDIRYLGMGGASNPFIVKLPFEISGVFKPKKIYHPSVNYKSEIAAYKIDNLIGFDVVPMTVKRMIKKRIGSVQYFVQDSIQSYSHKGSKRSKNLLVFDYLISNKDRNKGNLLVSWGREVAIDHGLCMRGINIIGAYLQWMDIFYNSLGMKIRPVRQLKFHPEKQIKMFVAEKKILDSLSKLEFKDLKQELGKLLNKRKLKKIYGRRTTLLNLLKQAQLYSYSTT